MWSYFTSTQAICNLPYYDQRGISSPCFYNPPSHLLFSIPLDWLSNAGVQGHSLCYTVSMAYANMTARWASSLYAMLVPYSFDNRDVQGEQTKILSKPFKIIKFKDLFHIIGAKENSKPAELLLPKPVMWAGNSLLWNSHSEVPT